MADHWPGPLPCLLERDARLPPVDEFHAELDAVAGAASLTRPQSDDHLTAVTAAAGPMPGARVRVGIDASLVDEATVDEGTVDEGTVDEGTVDEGTQVDAELLAGQIALVRTLTAGEDSPAGFAADRIEATRAALIDKRRLAVGEHWPALAETPGFHDGFAAVVARLPPTTTWADAHAYAQTHNGTLGVEARAELLLAATAGRRWALAASRRGGLLVAIRLPLLGLLILGRRR